MGRIRTGQRLQLPLYVALLISSSLLAAAPLEHVYVDDRTDYEKGKVFGTGGAYEFLEGSIVVGGTRIPFDYLKPRDPAKANGALLVSSGKTSVRDSDLIRRGYTFVRIGTGDAAAIREFVSYLRYGAPVPTFVLADQRRFIKQVVFVGDARSAESVIFTNSDAKSRPYFDGAVVTGKMGNFSVPEKLRVIQAETKPTRAILKLAEELKPASK